MAKTKEEIAERNKQYYLDNKEKIAEQRKQYRLNNKDKIKKQEKQSRLNNKEKIVEYQKRYRKDNKDLIERKKQYYRNNKDKILKRNKQYYLDNKEKIKEYKKQHIKIQRKTSPEFKLRNNVSRLISFALKRKGGSKHGESCLKYLPYTITELKQHLESQFESWMNWDNHGRLNSNKQTWQIDHKEAQSKFNVKKMGDEEFMKCWALSNLRPLGALENIKKGNK